MRETEPHKDKSIIRYYNVNLMDKNSYKKSVNFNGLVTKK